MASPARCGRSVMCSASACRRCAIATSPGTERMELRQAEIDQVKCIRWTGHGLNNGFIFTATHEGVARMPRAWSYGIGDFATWLHWRFGEAGPRGPGRQL